MQNSVRQARMPTPAATESPNRWEGRGEGGREGGKERGSSKKGNEWPKVKSEKRCVWGLRAGRDERGPERGGYGGGKEGG